MSLKILCTSYILTSAINKANCFKKFKAKYCVDLILTNCAQSLHNYCTIEMGFSYFPKMIVTVRKTSYQTIETQVINYRDDKVISNDKFRDSLHKVLNRAAYRASLGNDFNRYLQRPFKDRTS